MQNIKRQAGIVISTLSCVLSLLLAHNAVAGPISGLGSPSLHPELLGGSIIDFETDASGAAADTFAYPDVSIIGNNVLRITNSFAGLFNVTGNSMALTANDRTEEITFNFVSSVEAFGFNFGGTDLEWHLIAYSAAGTILDELAISPIGSSNNGEWFGISAAGIASARLYNTAFDVGSNTGTTDYVVIDNLTYVSAVPEPSTFLLAGLGLAGLAVHGRQQPNNKTRKQH